MRVVKVEAQMQVHETKMDQIMYLFLLEIQKFLMTLGTVENQAKTHQRNFSTKVLKVNKET